MEYSYNSLILARNAKNSERILLNVFYRRIDKKWFGNVWIDFYVYSDRLTLLIISEKPPTVNR